MTTTTKTAREHKSIRTGAKTTWETVHKVLTDEQEAIRYSNAIRVIDSNTLKVVDIYVQ